MEQGRAKSFLDMLWTREKGIDTQDKTADIVRMEKKLASLRDKKISLSFPGLLALRPVQSGRQWRKRYLSWIKSGWD